MTFTYSLGKKQYQEGQRASCIQFPLMLGYAMTIHKVQGANFLPPNTITTCFRDVFEGSMSYIALGRIKGIRQLYLLNGIYEDNIYTSLKALKALKKLEDRAINANSIGRRNDIIKIACLNVQNLRHHFADVYHDHKLKDQNLFSYAKRGYWMHQIVLWKLIDWIITPRSFAVLDLGKAMWLTLIQYLPFKISLVATITK